jgi:CreA protein
VNRQPTPEDPNMRQLALAAALIAAMMTTAHAQGADDPELIFKKTTVWRMLSPDAKLATYALDDPLVDGVACHFTVPEIGGWKGWAGFAEERSEISLACRQVGPISFTGTFEQGEDMYRQRRSMFFKKMQIVRGCDAARNVLVYLVYSDRIIEGSPQNSTSTVPIMPWGDEPAPRCAEFLED